MSAVVVATSPVDVRAVEALKDPNPRLSAALAVPVEALPEAPARRGPPGGVAGLRFQAVSTPGACGGLAVLRCLASARRSETSGNHAVSVVTTSFI